MSNPDAPYSGLPPELHGFAGKPDKPYPALPPLNNFEQELLTLLRRVVQDTADIKRLLSDIAVGF